MKMQFHRHPSPAGNVVKSCDAAGVVVGDVRYEGSIIVAPHKLQRWRPAAADDITEEDLQAIVSVVGGGAEVIGGRGETVSGGVVDGGRGVGGSGGGEVVLLGSNYGKPPKPEWLAFFAANGMTIETMPPAAACRTYSVLITDERPAVLAIVIPA